MTKSFSSLAAAELMEVSQPTSRFDLDGQNTDTGTLQVARRQTLKSSHSASQKALSHYSRKTPQGSAWSSRRTPWTFLTAVPEMPHKSFPSAPNQLVPLALPQARSLAVSLRTEAPLQRQLF